MSTRTDQLVSAINRFLRASGNDELREAFEALLEFHGESQIDEWLDLVREMPIDQQPAALQEILQRQNMQASVEKDAEDEESP